MSGFEVAGVVLGAIPLLISGLEHYSEGVAVLKTMKEYECVFADIDSSFAVSVGIYTESCYKLLAPLNLPDTQLKNLLLEKDSQKMQDAWKDINLELKLSNRLGANCKSYLSFVDKLNRRIMKLAHKLKLGPDFKASLPRTFHNVHSNLSKKPPWVSKDGEVDEKARDKFFNSAWTRIRGGFESNKCALLLQEIDRDISKISHLTSVTMEIEPLRLKRKRRMRARLWTGMRDSAQSLSEILRLNWANPCPCQYSHRANLQLNAQIDDEADDDDDTEQLRFALLFTFDKAAAAAPPVPWKWRDVEIQSSGLAQNIALNTPGRSVRFHISPPAKATPAPKANARPIRQAALTASKIHDLCESLVSKSSQNCCIGFLEDQRRRHHLFLVAGPGVENQIMSEVSLHYLLLETHKMVLGPREKCTLALNLATAVLQLYDTPWLATSWNLRDICFLRDMKEAYLLDRPYLSLSIGPGTFSTAQAAYRRRLVKNEIVFALGIALLELSYSQPLFDLADLFDLDENGNRDIMTEYSTATRLAKDIHHRELPNYAKAVLRCIHCNFDTFSYDLSEQEFRERFYEGVVVPLREDWEYATK